MVAVACCVFLFPISLGIIWNRLIGKQANHIAISFVMGCLTMLAIFEVFAAPLVMRDVPLVDISSGWKKICMIGSPIFLVIGAKQMQRIANNLIRMIKGWDFAMWFLVAASIVLLIAALLFSVPNSSDDTVEQILIMQAGGGYYRLQPFLGTVLSEPDTARMKAPLEVLYACISLQGGITAKVLVQKILPILFVPVCYLLYWDMGTYFFGQDEKKKRIFFWTVLIIHVTSFFMERDLSMGLFLNSWSSKTLLVCLVLPCAFHLSMRWMFPGKIVPYYEGKRRCFLLSVCMLAVVAGAAQLAVNGAWFIVLLMFLFSVAVRGIFYFIVNY